MKKRSQQIVLSNEAKVLRALRVEHKLLMKKTATLMGISDSTIAHTETGRMNPPAGDWLERFLRVYGGIKAKSFYERVRIFEDSVTPRDELYDLIFRANDEEIKTVLAIVRGILVWGSFRVTWRFK